MEGSRAGQVACSAMSILSVSVSFVLLCGLAAAAGTTSKTAELGALKKARPLGDATRNRLILAAEFESGNATVVVDCSDAGDDVVRAVEHIQSLDRHFKLDSFAPFTVKKMPLGTIRQAVPIRELTAVRSVLPRGRYHVSVIAFPSVLRVAMLHKPAIEPFAWSLNGLLTAGKHNCAWTRFLVLDYLAGLRMRTEDEFFQHEGRWVSMRADATPPQPGDLLLDVIRKRVLSTCEIPRGVVDRLREPVEEQKCAVGEGRAEALFAVVTYAIDKCGKKTQTC